MRTLYYKIIKYVIFLVDIGHLKYIIKSMLYIKLKMLIILACCLAAIPIIQFLLY